MQQAGSRFGGSRSFELKRLALIAAGVAAAAVTATGEFTSFDVLSINGPRPVTACDAFVAALN